MKNKILKSFVPFALLLPLLVGCNGGGGGSESTSKSSSSSSQTSTVIPPSYDEPSIQIHYNFTGTNYSKRALWMWNKALDNGKEYTYNGSDEFGAIAAYPLSAFGGDVLVDGLGLIDKALNSWDGQGPDLTFDFSLAKKDQNDVYHCWLKHFENNVLYYEEPSSGYDVTGCYFTDVNKLYVSVAEEAKYYKLYEDKDVMMEGEYSPKTMRLTLPRNVKLTKNYNMEITFVRNDHVKTVPVDINRLFNTEEFNNLYYYSGELGAIYSKAATEFKVWSPLSSEVKLRIYNNGTPKSVDATKGDDAYQEYQMNIGEKGVWSHTINGDMEGKYYTYVVTNSKFKNTEIVDPYAKSAGVNGLRGMIVDFSRTNPEGWDKVTIKPYDRKELTVWETHVADVTSSSTWGGSAKNAKKFLGLIEPNTKYTKNDVTVTTGFDHIKELGVNAVQLLPIFDQANDEVNVEFNWGYNPLNYNVLEGCYSSNPFDGYARIKEFKEVVKGFNAANINIIMDVVYNHVNGLSGCNFDVLLPGYFFRYTSSNTPYNGSGCGNETASDNLMFRKFMIDSTEFWAKEYKLGGFRFDLMGLHDLDTMELLSKNLKEKVNEHITVYGEPWTGGTSGLSANKQAKQDNLNSFVGYGCFNDKMRDALVKGGLSTATETGWAMDNPSKANTSSIQEGLLGKSTYSLGEPDKTVNYVTCHDNYCLYDRMKAGGITDEEKIIGNLVLANSFVFTSQGTSFMLAGEECVRTKGGNSNSYNASYEVNEINYERKLNHLDVFENYKALINFKQVTKALHYGKDAAADNMTFEVNDTANYIVSTIKDGNTEYKIIYCNGKLVADTSMDLTGYRVIHDTVNENTGVIAGSVTLKPYQTLILSK